MSIPELQVEPARAPLNLDPEGPHVVAIGGGHGLAQVLEAVQSYAGRISAIVTVSDDGGSSGRLLDGLSIPPPGDVRRALLALAPEPSEWTELFGYRFGGSDVDGHALGNLVIAAFADLLDDFHVAVATCGRALGCVGDVIPVASRWLRLCADVEGRRVEGQVAIAQSRGFIESLELLPDDVEAHIDALDAIASAGQIVLSPGSLFTSLLSVLIVPGVVQAIEASDAALVHVLNLVTQDGETLAMSGRDHVEAIERITGLRRTGVVLAHEGSVAAPDGLEIVRMPPAANVSGWTVVNAPVADANSRWPQHDPILLGSALASLAMP